MPLCNCIKDKRYEVISLPDMHLLKALGIRKGIGFKIKSKQPFSGPIVVQIANRDIAIAYSLAEGIIVREVS